MIALTKWDRKLLMHFVGCSDRSMKAGWPDWRIWSLSEERAVRRENSILIHGKGGQCVQRNEGQISMRRNSPGGFLTSGIGFWRNAFEIQNVESKISGTRMNAEDSLTITGNGCLST